MKVVFPLPAMPTQTIATGDSVLPGAGADDSEAFEVDMLEFVPSIKLGSRCAWYCASVQMLCNCIYPRDCPKIALSVIFALV
jgi:hypothetical protein